jgi:pimeloyl-ACP methyl ester carboxylesterase
MIAPMLIEGRAKLVETNGGVRSKVRTEDGNDIDTMFVDRRNSLNHHHGDYLVICSEGNAGFYEVGCMCTPLEAGYSVLGWNHPGFWGSTGAPYPSQEQNAISAVMQYAINRLGFPPEKIILCAWSIGGYSATWAAMNYPDIGHVVLDATFDDILPLAVVKMPASWRSIVEYAIRQHLNLNNAELLCKYPGPILLIRRSKDEMITTIDPTVLSSNRGNDLVIKLLRHRYPSVIDDSTILHVREWLSTDQSGQAVLRSQYGVSDDVYDEVCRSNPSWSTRNYPSSLGEGLSREIKIQLALFLVSKYLVDYDSTHCTPLPPIYFHEPWMESPSI